MSVQGAYQQLKIDSERVVSRITSFIKDFIIKSNRSGIVIGLSGGIDSTVTAYLCVKALGNKNVFGLIMPEANVTPEEDIKDALSVAKKLDIEYRIVDITNYVKNIEALIPNSDQVSRGNIRARIRMVILYYYANVKNYLVVGTGDKSEILLGYFTKYGDGASDFMPIADLYKTQVRELGKYLEVPENILLKKSSPRLWAGQMAETELGLSYDIIDPILYALVDLRLDARTVSEKLNVSEDLVRSIYNRVLSNEHKRRGPMIVQVGSRGYGIGFRIPFMSGELLE
ncbi:MAG: NAD+ synthase [Thermoprotei archaeon]